MLTEIFYNPIETIANSLSFIASKIKNKEKSNSIFDNQLCNKVSNVNFFLPHDDVEFVSGAVETFWGAKKGEYEITMDEKPIIETKTDDNNSYILKNKVNVTITYFNSETKKIEVYKFSINPNYTWDGASIPKCLQWLIGKNITQEFKVASMIHDYLCENKDIIKGNRALSTAVFGGLLVVNRTAMLKSLIMIKAVDLYQKIFGNWKNNTNFA